MQHLGNLRVFNLVYAVLDVLVGLLFVVLWGIGGILAIRDGEPMGWLFLLGGVVACALLWGLAALHVRVAQSLPLSRGRILQSALAVLQIAAFPIGTAYALYALWVCWINDETKTRFDLHDKA